MSRDWAGEKLFTYVHDSVFERNSYKGLKQLIRSERALRDFEEIPLTCFQNL